MIIDEISALKPEFLAIIDQRLRTLTEYFGEEFGGLFLMGDFFQLPPVKSKETLYSAVLKLSKLNQTSSSPALVHGAFLFSTFRLRELNQQMRAPDNLKHMEMLDRLRNPPQGKPPVSSEDISNIKFFETEDISEDETWITAPIIVLTNQERFGCNALQSAHFSKVKGKLRYIWNVPIRGDEISDLSQNDINQLFQNNLVLKHYFVKGAPGYLTRNINPSLGLANGTSVIYHSLILDEKEDQRTILEKVINSTSSIDILLKYPPKYVCVTVPTAELIHFENRTLVQGEVVIPLPLEKDPKLIKLKCPELLKNVSVLTERHSVEMKFSLTAHKVQGLTCPKLILDLNNRPSPPHMSLSSFHVGLSRVRSSCFHQNMEKRIRSSDRNLVSRCNNTK